MNIIFRTLWMGLFSFIFPCALLSIRIQPWFRLIGNLSALWKLILILAAAFAAII
ncbi:hypothetical protein RHGRI_033949 [Rhododendron griersonianum]|uniref:Uncharacterized protein n=1 Tax=Rhododendron griersonianum TaxID=479676 RepID=A0AAV6HYN5_9ERIC|nr:hypothetical protein RHGRI_033949 [Rhododendron griersonianum]